MSEKGYCIISDWDFKSKTLAAREEFIRSMAACEISLPKKKFHFSDLRSKPHRKLTVCSVNGLGETYPQVLQTTYFSIADPAYPNLGAVFNSLITIRNKVLGVRDDFGNDPANDKFWNACRLHHYPRGGSFMVGHKDTHFPSLLEEAGHPFLQALVILSTRSKDFHTGGGFVVDREGNKILYETEDNFGSIVCFDGSITHGVEDVDSDQILDFQQTSGRLAGFANLYKVLN